MVFFARHAALILCGILAASIARADESIIILRHGEKPAQGLGQLTCQGLNRALALPAILLSRYGTPSALYAPKPPIKKHDRGLPYAYIRPLATIEPLAIRAGLPVNIDWAMTDVKPFAGYLLAQPEGVYIIAWEHHYASKLARQILQNQGGDPLAVPDWEDNDFDSLYVIRLTTDNQGVKHVSFAHEQQGLNGLSESCD